MIITNFINDDSNDNDTNTNNNKNTTTNKSNKWNQAKEYSTNKFIRQAVRFKTNNCFINYFCYLDLTYDR